MKLSAYTIHIFIYLSLFIHDNIWKFFYFHDTLPRGNPSILGSCSVHIEIMMGKRVIWPVVEATLVK